MGLDICRRAGLSTARFSADPQGLRFDDPAGSLELPWSAVRDVSVDATRRGRASVALHLRDGSWLRPVALRRAEASVAREVERLWSVYGPPAAAAMWGRARRVDRRVVAG